MDFTELIEVRSADAARSRDLSGSKPRGPEGETDFACCTCAACAVMTLLSNFGALGGAPNDLSRSSFGNSRLVGMVARFGISPGRTHCMLFGPPAIGARGAEKFGRSEGGYIAGGLGAIGVLSALGPVGMLAGKLFGDVLIVIAPALTTRSPVLVEEEEAIEILSFDP